MKKEDLYLRLKYMNNPNYTEHSEIYSNFILNNGIEWLREHILLFHKITLLPNDYQCSYNSHKYERNKKYSKLIQTLKTVTALYTLIRNEYTNKTFIRENPNVYTKNPEFILDNYFYHPDRVFVVDYFKSMNLCDEFEDMYFHICNVLQELEFDLAIEPPLYNI
jgi:hypothetical protein